MRQLPWISNGAPSHFHDKSETAFWHGIGRKNILEHGTKYARRVSKGLDHTRHVHFLEIRPAQSDLKTVPSEQRDRCLDDKHQSH